MDLLERAPHLALLHEHLQAGVQGQVPVFNASCIYAKLGASNRLEAAQAAQQRGASAL